MLEIFEDFVEASRNLTIWPIVILLPLILLVTPACASREFPVFRLQGFESSGFKNGSFASSVSAEATVHVAMAHRKCFVVTMQDLTVSKLKDLLRIYPLAIVIVLPFPEDYVALSDEQTEQWMNVERMLIEQEYPIPIYFTRMDQNVRDVFTQLNSVSSTDHNSSATKALVDAIFGNGYQVVINAPAPSEMSSVKFANLLGSLYNTRRNVELDSLLFIAHYDAFSPSAQLSFESDASGTGVVALLSIASMMSRLYGSTETQPNFNSNFLLSGGGKVNFLGSSYFSQNNEHVTKSARVILCLDSLNGLPGDTDTLYLHRKTSKVTGTTAQLQDIQIFQEILSSSAEEAGLKFEVITRKANTNQWFSWEHERFSAYRAATISGHSNPQHPMRHSLLDNGQHINHKTLALKMQVIQKSLLQYMYNVSEALSDYDQFKKQNPYLDYLDLVQTEQSETLLDFVSSEPHSSQYLSKNDAYVQTLLRLLGRYTKQSTVHEFKLDHPHSTTLKRDDVAFYDQVFSVANAYRVKPAVFDLFLSIAIAAYIAAVYAVVQGIPVLHVYLRAKILPVPGSPAKTKLK